MSLNRQIAHNTITQIVGKIASTLLGLVAIGLMTRYLAPEKFGWYTTTITFLQFVAILIDFGLIPVTAQMLGEAKFEKKKLLHNLLAFRFLTAFIGFGIAPFIALFFSYPVEVKIAIGFSTLSFLAIAMNQIFTGFYQEQLKTYRLVLGDLLSRLTLVIGLFFLVKTGASFLPIMGLVTASSIVYTIILWLGARKLIPLGLAFDKDVWRAIAQKMWPIAISIVFNVIYLRGDTLILTFLRSQAEVGIYGAAYRVIDIVSQIAMLMMGIFLPLLASAWSSGNKQEFQKRSQLAFDMLMLFGVPVVVGTFILAPSLIVFVAGSDFVGSGIILRILSLAIFGVYLGAVFGHLAVAVNRQKATIWIYVSNAVLTLSGYLYFIPRYGLLGAAWMSVFSEMYAGILLFFTLKHFMNKLQVGTLAKIIFSGAGMGLLLFILQGHLHILLLVLLGALGYMGLLSLFGVITAKTVQEIFSPEKT